jgi:acetolactate synthase-1/2/3 large subunit
MKKTGAWLVVYALEQVGIKYTFGIPGVHNTEIYDELNKSDKIEPVLVTHEGGGAFMADAMSRTTDTVGCLVIVPAAGMTHALSGIGEAYLAGVPMLVLSGGIRTDTGRSYQLHDIDQHTILSGITKKSWKALNHHDIIPMIYEAYDLAISGEPGPVFVEIPVNLQLFKGEINEVPVYTGEKLVPSIKEEEISDAVELLKRAKKPGIFIGWGARDASDEIEKIAEILAAPVATTLQGLSSLNGSHPLHTGMGIGKYAVPASEAAFQGCDCLLAIGTRFGEIATGSFGMNVPKSLIHVDINPTVFNKNYTTEITITGDAKEVSKRLLVKLDGIDSRKERLESLQKIIRKEKAAYQKEWEEASVEDMVNPALFFQELRRQLKDDAIITVDDGNHTFLTAELFQVRKPSHLISPTDFNCMGYCVPAAIGAKLGNRDKEVVGIVGDGAFLMTGMELLTASMLNLGVIIMVFNDGELSQISQGQTIPYNRKVCTQLGKIDLEGVAIATGTQYLQMVNNQDIQIVIEKALHLASENVPVIVDINIDYSKQTRFTKGIVKTNLDRFPLSEKIRFISRALRRKITG